jgi:hypothetical protein
MSKIESANNVININTADPKPKLLGRFSSHLRQPIVLPDTLSAPDIAFEIGSCAVFKDVPSDVIINALRDHIRDSYRISDPTVDVGCRSKDGGETYKIYVWLRPPLDASLTTTSI